MSNKKSSRPSLALFTAIALSGGAFFAPSFASGADVTIDSTHPPQRNVPNPDDPSTPNSAASVGTGSEDASGNSLTVDRYQEDTLSVFGGVARGTGNADGNTVRIKGAMTEIASVYGGAAWGTGHARENRVRFDAGTMSFAEWLVGGYVGRSGRAEENTVEVNGGKAESLYGGFSNSTNATGRIHKNHVVIRGGTIAGKVYGGAFGGAHATGDVTHNTVTITGGTLKKDICGGSLEKADSTGNVAHNEVTVAGGVFRKDVYGGYTRRGGALTGNIVTITGGELNSVYAAYSAGNVSEIKGNVVNLGDGKNEMKVGYRIAKYIFGASGGNRASYADNTLNVKASARAKNIVNFDKVNFYFTDTLQPRLTLRDSTGTKFKSLKDIAIYGSPSTPAGTLIENDTSGGVVVRDGVNTVVRTGDTAEVTLEKDATGRKILYSRLIFKGATTAESDGTHIWGGRSAIGNTTTGNDVALANGSYANAYGGWTTGTGSDAAADRLGDSTGNKITVSGTATVTGTVYGGYTDAAGGKAWGNSVTIESAVHDVVGGEGAGEASGNIVNIRANAAAVTGGRGAVANGNIVNLGNVTVASVTGGEGATTNNNEVHLNGNVRVTDALKGGSQASGMGNTLSVKGKGNKAEAITGFQKLKFDAAGLAKDDTMLEVTGMGETAVDWASLTATGTAAKPLTLLKNEQGINLAHYTGAAKSETSDEAEMNIDVRKTGARITAITYEGYRFKGATQATREGRDAYGGRSKVGNSTRENEIALSSGTHANVYGGWTSGVGTTALDKGASYENKVKISGTATVTGTVYGGYTDAAGGKARGNTVTIESAVHDVVGGEGAGEASGNIVNIRANATAVTGGRSTGAASNNRVTLGNITAVRVVGGDGGTTAEGNTVSLDGTTVTNDVIGGKGAAANGNAVSLSNTHVNGAVMGGHGTVQSDGNTVSLQNTAVNGAVTGGEGTATSGNIIHLRNTVVNGIVTGGTASGGVDNTLAVYYSAGTSSIHDFKGIENLRLDVEDAPTDGTAHPLLKLTNVSGGSKNLTNMTLDFRRSGAARKLQAGDSFTLLENASGKITVGEGVTMKGTDGIAHDCLFAIAPDKAHPERLRATVTKTGVGETAKSPVETRAGLANFVNQSADYLVESGFTAAEMSAESGAENASADDTAESSSKDTQRRTAAADSASYHLWAGAGANAMRVESGSYVDSKGWNLGVGWAREDAAKGGTKRLFSPFVEYGRGTYDSYLDNGAHGSGKLSYFGLGVLGKLTQQDGLWFEASARAGRAKSDYSLHGENAGYDGSNTYYGIHLGVGKTFALQKGASLDAYVRYFWSHQDGMSVKLRGSGDAYDFADVDSHRLRLGLRYSRKDRSTGECYAGLAWEHELGGEASASVGGDAAPSPSLKGSSCMLEIGYRFLPQNSRISYDFHIDGWQGKRKGLSGGAAIQWTF
ncbi:autotransporter subunit beta [uncultured Selenomonas sp.]|uniref:autotransporter subunit beta n=1 Tax=uncultured Selenomonas sp. TaxID=159275 RepID=UPI0028D08CE5|nr:autotransporter subunit beta [uncultured Selenomonas sp.]